LSTRVGYAGGAHADPTYHDLGNHTEAVEVTFDPRRISFSELLDIYWLSFPFQIPPGPSRVQTAIISRGEAQAAAATASKRKMDLLSGERVHTRIIADGAFWPAEHMHQKFNLQRVHPDLVQHLAGHDDVDTFLASTAAARLNAYVSGFTDPSVLADAARELGWEVEDLLHRLQPPSSAGD
jgi:peptide-methionine (S)-S-oxide reductase